MHRGNWDDLRFVLAVAEAGSVAAAARGLGVNHATVLRRIAAFEDARGIEIFERSAQGYRIPPDRLRVIEAAREVEIAMGAVERTLQGAEAALSGAVRITSTDTFCQVVLPGVIAGLQSEAEGLRIELQCSNTHLDLSRLHADIAVRPADTLPEDLFGEQAGRLGFGVYGAVGQGDLPWLRLTGALARSRVAKWLGERLGEAGEASAGGADSFLVLRELAAAGLGRAILPCYLGDSDGRLERRRDEMPDVTVPIWVASHVDLADAPRLRRIRERLAEALVERIGALEGAG